MLHALRSSLLGKLWVWSLNIHIRYGFYSMHARKSSFGRCIGPTWTPNIFNVHENKLGFEAEYIHAITQVMSLTEL